MAPINGTLWDCIYLDLADILILHLPLSIWLVSCFNLGNSLDKHSSTLLRTPEFMRSRASVHIKHQNVENPWDSDLGMSVYTNWFENFRNW